MTTLALIGVGNWGKNYLKAAKQIGNCRIKYIFAKSAKNLKQFSTRYICSIFIDELFTLNDLDGIIIATPAETHFKLVKKCIENKIPVLVEKPLTITLRETKELIRLSKKFSSLVLVGHIYLHNPAFQVIKKKLITMGEILYLSFEAGNNGPARSYTTPLWDWGPHDISMLLELTNELPLSVSSWMIKNSYLATQNNYLLRLKFANFPVFITLGNLFPIKKRIISIKGTKKSIIYDEPTEQKIAVINHETNKSSFLIYNSEKQPLINQLEFFLGLIREKKTSPESLTLALKIAQILDGVEHSLESKTPYILKII